MSSLIVELVNAIYTNGNAKFYFGNTREKDVHLINFEVDQTGKLSIRSKMEEYDQKFSDGKSINPNAKLKSSFDVTDIDYAENKLDIIISLTFLSFLKLSLIRMDEKELTTDLKK